MRRRLAGCLLLLTTWFAPPLVAQPAWRPAVGPLDAPPTSAATQAPTPVTVAQAPAVSLGRPVQATAGDNSAARQTGEETTEFAAHKARPQGPLAVIGAPRAGAVVRAQNGETAFPSGKPVSGWVGLGAPTTGGSGNGVKVGGPGESSDPPAHSSSARAPADAIFPTEPNARPTRQVRYDESPEERFNRGMVSDPLLGDKAPLTRSSRYGDSWIPFVNNHTQGCDAASGQHWFCSDQAFRDFASPVTNPFLFEDPRSLTEVRPIFIFQKGSNNNPFFQGGQSYFLGTQARLALTQNLSLTLNKLGGVLINPGSDSNMGTETGFAEIWLGPKLTFWRDDQAGFVAAAGTIFQIPAGSGNTFQDTGTLSIVPYLSAAKNFFGTSSFGGINLMDTVGYAFAINGGRSEYLYNSFHVDYDVGNQHRVFPLMELNWFYYTKSGGDRPIPTEGLDLANIGGIDVDGKNFLSIAGGLRYRFNEKCWLGGAIEFPLVNDLRTYDYRLTVDFIWRF
jgi:hypothetical protein